MERNGTFLYGDHEFVKRFLERIGGELAPNVVSIILDKGKTTDEEIAEILKVEKVTVVRSVLNRLHYWGIVAYDKIRDEETGWYTYLWHVQDGKIEELIKEEIEEEIAGLKKKLEENETYMFFECENKCERMVFEVAAEYGFRCPHCGLELKPVDVEEENERIRKRIEELTSLLSELTGSKR